MAEQPGGGKRQKPSESRPSTESSRQSMAPPARFPPMLYWAKATATVLMVGIVFALAYIVRSTLLMVAVAFIIAVGLEPSVRMLQRLGLHRALAVALIFLVAIGTLVGFLVVVIPPVVEQVYAIASDVPSFIAKLQARSDLIGQLATKYDIATRAQSMLQDLPDTIFKSFDQIAGAAGQVVGAVVNGFTLLILTLYFLLAGPAIRRTITRLGGEEDREKAFSDALDRIGGYVTGNLTTSAVAGTVAFIFLSVVGVPYAAALAFWFAVMDLIPTVGAVLGALAAVLMGATKSIPLAVGIAVFFVIYQQFEGYVLCPRIYSKTVDLSPISILVAIIIGGALLGIAGMLLALPLTAAGKVLFQYWYQQHFGHPWGGEDELAETG